MAIKKFIDSTGLATLWEKIKALIPGIATSSKAGIVKSGGDITVASDGVVSVNDNSHNHFYEMGVFYGESGVGGYINFCTITVNVQYKNEPFTLDLSSRGRLGTLTINLGIGASTTITAPSLVWISDLIEASPIWYKVSGNMLYLYWQKSDAYDEMSVTGLNVGLYTYKGVTFSWGNTYVTATTGLTNVLKSNYKVNCYSFNDANVSGYTIDSFWVELLYKSGCVGSVYLFKKSSGVGSEIVEGWYNFVYMPYGNGVSAAGYRSYGSIILTPMTMSTSSWALRVTNSASTVTEAIKLSKYGISDISGLQAALDGKINKQCGWCVTNVTTPYWFMIASYTCTSEWFDMNTTFIASYNFYSQSAIITAKFRQATMGVVEICSLTCISKEGAFPLGNLAIAYKGTSGSKSEFQIWAKCAAIYQSMSIMPLYNGTRDRISNSAEYWTLNQVTHDHTNYRAFVNSDGLFTHPDGFSIRLCSAPEYRKLNDVLEITDSNLATYYNSGTEVLSGISNTIGTILINCSSRKKISAIQMTDVFNGKRVSLIGEFVPSERYSYNNTVSGGFSSYLYTHRSGSPNSSLSNDTVIRGYEDFIYFNGKWYGKGY